MKHKIIDSPVVMDWGEEAERDRRAKEYIDEIQGQKNIDSLGKAMVWIMFFILVAVIIATYL